MNGDGFEDNGRETCICGRDYVAESDTDCWICQAERNRGEVSIADEQRAIKQREAQIAAETDAMWEAHEQRQQRGERRPGQRSAFMEAFGRPLNGGKTYFSKRWGKG